MRHDGGVTICAFRPDLLASGKRIPRRLGPFNLTHGHYPPLSLPPPSPPAHTIRTPTHRLRRAPAPRRCCRSAGRTECIQVVSVLLLGAAIPLSGTPPYREPP